MSQQFLSQVLKVENETADSLVASLLQVEVGSACIAIWLRTNNTCPVCRRVFFAAQPPPYLDSIPFEDEDSEIEDEPVSLEDGPLELMYEPVPATVRWAYVTTDIDYLCDAFCEELAVSHNTFNVAREMAQRLALSMGEHHTPGYIVSVTFYMVTHIMNERRSLEEIWGIANVQTEEIHQAYRRIHPTREQLILPHMFAALGGDSVQNFLESLPSPSTENGFTDQEDGGTDLEHYLVPAQPKRLEELCNQYSDELAYFGGIRDICLQIAGKIRAGLYLAGLSPLPVIAVSLYMASHLASFGTPIRQISEVVGISEGTIRNAYRRVHPWRGELIDSDMLDTHEDVRRHRVLRAIAWPAL
ncbi:hypothetical protein HO133_009901 [Letharia lupina]|uniref:Transcription factor TFIIB cyclin-like domain-containing protein n=1 Tax=Letharia lupina TaxID=560253 RepID=A0A8H6CLW0_9LECA|nr:uncharacterized protein HO133_009901 [Letharia lupina]KAF6225898.1 hypothetical protein HO133_009901 [Letharia lupina]